MLGECDFTGFRREESHTFPNSIRRGSKNVESFDICLFRHVWQLTQNRDTFCVGMKIDLADWSNVKGGGGRREYKRLLYCFHHIVSRSILIYLHWYDSVYIQLWPTKWPWHKHEKSFQYTRLYSSSCRQDKRCQFFSNEIRFCQHRRCHPEDRYCIIIITMFDCSVFFFFFFFFPSHSFQNAKPHYSPHLKRE